MSSLFSSFQLTLAIHPGKMYMPPLYRYRGFDMHAIMQVASVEWYFSTAFYPDAGRVIYIRSRNFNGLIGIKGSWQQKILPSSAFERNSKTMYRRYKIFISVSLREILSPQSTNCLPF